MPTPTVSGKLLTPSLIAEPLHESHLPFLLTLHGDLTTMATNGGVRTQQQTEQYLETNLQHWTNYGFGLWVFRHKVTDQPIGRGGLRYVTIEGVAEAEVAYTVHASYWGKGFGTEMGKLAVLEAPKYGLSDLVAFTLPDNKPSRRVMEKIGFRYDRQIQHLGLVMVLYRLGFKDIN